MIKTIKKCRIEFSEGTDRFAASDQLFYSKLINILQKRLPNFKRTKPKREEKNQKSKKIIKSFIESL